MESKMLVNEKEAAHLLSLSIQTLRNWRCLRRGPAYLKIGSRAIRYSVKDLQHYACSKRVDPKQIK